MIHAKGTFYFPVRSHFWGFKLSLLYHNFLSNPVSTGAAPKSWFPQKGDFDSTKTPSSLSLLQDTQTLA